MQYSNSFTIVFIKLGLISSTFFAKLSVHKIFEISHSLAIPANPRSCLFKNQTHQSQTQQCWDYCHFHESESECESLSYESRVWVHQSSKSRVRVRVRVQMPRVQVRVRVHQNWRSRVRVWKVRKFNWKVKFKIWSKLFQYGQTLSEIPQEDIWATFLQALHSLLNQALYTQKKVALTL